MFKGARRVVSGFAIVTYNLICGVCSIRKLMNPSFDKFIERFIYTSVQTFKIVRMTHMRSLLYLEIRMKV